MRTPFIAVVVLIVVVSPGGATAWAQGSRLDPMSDTTRPTSGWIVTPSLGYAGVWDDNALMLGTGEVQPRDFTNAISPRIAVEFKSGRNEFSADYDGALVAYRELSSLNSFYQHGSVRASRLLTRRLSLFGRGSVSKTPTTEALGLVAVPFVRVGSRLAEMRTGVEAALTRHTSISADYGFQWVDFDRDPQLGLELLGGTSHGASASVRHALSRHFTIIGNYDLQFATVVDGGRFQVQNAQGGVELQPWDSGRVFGMVGMSRLDFSGLVAPRTGPAVRIGLAQRIGSGSVDVGYSRAFVPALGFAGTFQNEELSSRLMAPLGRRFYTRAGLSWQHNEPLIAGDLKLKSMLIEGSLGYAFRPWMRLEGFYDGRRQAIERPGGRLDHNRVGLQLITAKPMRIR